MKASNYDERNIMLSVIGFNSYKEYQESLLWANIRLKVLKRDKWACQLCGDNAKTVHHSIYTDVNLLGESLEYLHSLCHACHKRVEFDGDTKLSAEKALRKFKNLLNQPRPKKKRRKGSRPEIGRAYARIHIARKRGRK